MTHIPFGYKIIDGCAVVDETAAKQLKEMYHGYLGGKSLMNAANDAGINCFHGAAAKMLSNKKYLGTDYYPQIIDEDTFEKAKAERDKRADMLGRNNFIKEKEQVTAVTSFLFKMADKSFNDPFEQASYIYSLIESEE